MTTKPKMREEIYRLMDSFLVETDSPRSIDQLNQDRHLFVKNILDLIFQKEEDVREEIRKNGDAVIKKHKDWTISESIDLSLFLNEVLHSFTHKEEVR